MNLFNLILIMLIITILPFLTFLLNNSLLFIKPENLTKTELVEKFKELSSSKSLKELKKEDQKDVDQKDKDKTSIKDFLKNLIFRLSALFFKFKNFIVKITLFTILIKYFRKIKIIRIVFRIINYTFLSTLGIFITDIYGLKEIIVQIEYYWMKYVDFIHENKIYKTLLKIFNVISSENKSEIIEDKSKLSENKLESKIIDSEIPSSRTDIKKEEIIHDKTSRGNEKEEWLKLNKYWIGLSILSLTLIYFYWDSIIELFKNVKPDNNPSPSPSPTSNDNPIFSTPEEEYKKYFKEISTNEELYDLEIIKDQNQGKTIEYIDVENTKWEDNASTPKATTSNLPNIDKIILPISRK